MNQIIFSASFSLLLFSCNGQLNTNLTCSNKFKKARDLAYLDLGRQSALDSAMVLANECLQCENIRKAVVDFKITLLVHMKKFEEGISFINSLGESDFTFGYKKNLVSKSLLALDYGTKNNSTKQHLIYKEVANDMEQYILKHTMSDIEFKEIYTDLFGVKENYLDASKINTEVEKLKKMYPDKQTFFDFFSR